VEPMIQYLKNAEDSLTDIYRRLAAFPPPSTDDIQRDIADVVVLLYGLRRNGDACPVDAHPLVFAAQIEKKAAAAAAKAA